jgi:hypothetical protein
MQPVHEEPGRELTPTKVGIDLVQEAKVKQFPPFIEANTYYHGSYVITIRL